MALASGSGDKIRTLKLSEHPSDSTHNLYVSEQVVTVLRFDQDVDPTQMKLLGWEGRFEPPLVGSKRVVIVPLRVLRPDGSPRPEDCSDKARETMRILRMRVGDSADVDLDTNQSGTMRRTRLMGTRCPSVLWLGLKATSVNSFR
ncbi:DUF2381 family protein [Hyalangium sp.]|uniref:DUF2381 family protein n=1 Tax=Hyalangium sp. TaxID=2028555 RepID=UPI002D55B36F|nr:DUF2381 family protein [Hyalangium sp.]HYI02594.1 DUF2381 family protein [Hyalangium sp.]